MAIVLVTGCSSGFGLAAAKAFASNGDTVYAAMRDLAKGVALVDSAKSNGWDVRPVQLDVARPELFAPLIDGIVRNCGRLDVLVNNAGVIRLGAFEDQNAAQIREVFETNTIAPLLLTRAVLPQMRHQESGCIIMISSLSGVAGLPGDVTYTASKFAVEGATEALRHEVDRWNIRVALVEAGLYATRIFEPSIETLTQLPRNYPTESPYRELVAYKLQELRKRLPDAFDPQIVGDLLVKIAASDGRQLRWPADAVATRVLATVFGQDDATRDQFLRKVSGTDWWSERRERPATS